MKRKALGLSSLVVAIAAVVLVVAVSGGAAKTRQSRIPSSAAISVKTTSLGRTLVDANGRTMYLFAADHRNVSTLSSAGRAVWPPLTAARIPTARGGAQAAKIGLAAGHGAKRQVTYNGHPLYYFVGDSKPGSTRGQGLNEFGAHWYVLSSSGAAITSAPSTPAPAPAQSGTGYSYGY